MGQAGAAGPYCCQAPVGRPLVTEFDRWWVAYCALGVALVIRAPSWGWAILVVVLWGAMLLVSSLDSLRWPFVRRVSEPDDRASAAGRFADRARADKTMVIPRAAPATVTEVADRRRISGLDPMGAEVSRVVISGRVWATDELLGEIRTVIERRRPSGGAQ